MLGLTAESILRGAVLYGLLGAALGLLLGRLARPRWHALPRRIAPRAPEIIHAAYGAIVATAGGLVAWAMLAAGWRWPTGHDVWYFVPAFALAIVGAVVSTALAPSAERLSTFVAHARTILLVSGVLLLFLAAMSLLVDVLWRGSFI